MNDHPDARIESIIGLILRIYWLIAGGFISIMIAVVMAVDPPESPYLHTIAFWLNAAGMVLARFLDISYFDGLTTDGESATLKDWRRYALLVIAASAAAWIGARVAGNLLKP